MSKLIQYAWNITTEKLVKFSLEDSFENQISMAFGSDVSINLVRDSFQNIIEGTNIPTVIVLPTAKINGANGAFVAKTNTIYLAQEYLESNDSENLSNLLLEELGHYLDWRLNEVDSPGDEGAIFSALVRGESLSESRLRKLKTENDSAIIFINREKISIEQDSSNTEIRLRTFIPSEAISLTPEFMTFTSIYGGDNRSFSYDSGTNRSFQNVVVDLALNNPSPIVSEIENLWGETFQYDSNF